MKDLEVLLSVGEDCPQRQHLILFHAFYNSFGRDGALLELATEARLWAEREMGASDFWNSPNLRGSSPRELVRLWPEGGESMPPRELLNMMVRANKDRIRGPDVAFDYLSALPDRNGMRVLRSKHQIIDAGEQLHNCAATDPSYASRAERKQLVLVVMCDENGQPKAMGQHNIRGQWPEGGWSVIREAYNHMPSEQTLARFRRYGSTFRSWHRGQFARPVATTTDAAIAFTLS
jgi:hypothetical protein